MAPKNEKKEAMMRRVQTTIAVIGAVVTILSSVGGSYLTVQLTLAKHEERINTIKKDISELQYENKEDRKILNRIDKTVAVMNERTRDR